MNKPFDKTHSSLVTLNPGDLFFDKGNYIPHTLLGSCVAITLWHPKEKVGGMCHYLLACRDKYVKNEHHPKGYYASDAIEYFNGKISKLGLDIRDFEAKLFGGGNILESPKEHLRSIDVAGQNVEVGKRLLEDYGYNVRVEDVGGVRYRHIYFELSTGDVWVKYGKYSKTEDPHKNN